MTKANNSRSGACKVQVLLFDGFDDLDVFGIYEPLCMAGFKVDLLCLREQKTVITSHNVRIVPHGRIDLKTRPDILCVPGGGWLERSDRGAWAEAERGDILQVLKEFHAQKTVVAAVCTGALLLARAGLLTGRPATTNHAAIEELKMYGAKVTDSRVVDDGDIITAGGITSSVDLGLWLIRRFVGIDEAKDISGKLEFEPRDHSWNDSIR